MSQCRVGLTFDKHCINWRFIERATDSLTPFGTDTFLGDALTQLLLDIGDDELVRKALLKLRFSIRLMNRIKVGGRIHHRSHYHNAMTLLSTPLWRFTSSTKSTLRIRVCEMEHTEWLLSSSLDNLQHLMAWNLQCNYKIYRDISRVIQPLWNAMWWGPRRFRGASQTNEYKLCVQFHWLSWGRIFAMLSVSDLELVNDVANLIKDLYHEMCFTSLTKDVNKSYLL